MKRLASITLATSVIISVVAGLVATSVSAPITIDPVNSNWVVKSQVQNIGLSESLVPAPGFEEFGKAEDDRSFHSDILYSEVVLSYGPLEDPRPIFLLANSYIVANQQKYGIAFLEKILKRYENQFSDQAKANYLSAYALLRATYAEEVFLLNRIGWVNDTFEILDQAREISGENNPLVRWASGLIYAQVPWFFGKQDSAFRELTWLVEHPETEPEPGFYREAYHYLARIHEDLGNSDIASQYLLKSGYQDYEPSVLFMGWFASSKEKGLLFSPTPWIEEIVPERVFAVRGFGFSEMHFIVSEDEKQLISIDAGTQPFSMEAGFKFLMDRHPDLPPLTTTIFTHAHWDHIGGSSFLKSLNPDLKFYGRENFHGTLDRSMRKHTYEQFRSASFSFDWIKDYQPDVSVSELTNIEIGGTQFELIPVTGGETEDALLINMPKEKVIFIGDILMPFYGEPWVEEGFIDEAVDAMDTVIARNPEYILNGHYALNYLYAAENIAAYRETYVWLVKETRKHLENGYSIKDIVRLNLIPPILTENPEAIVAFQSPRNHIIARLGDHMLGIWQEGISGKEPVGLDVISSVEYGRFLDLYLGLSSSDVEEALRSMMDGGDNELALQMAIAAEARYQNNSGITRLKEEAADRARGAVQFLDPFSFVVYTEMAGKEQPSIPAGIIKKK